MSPYTRLSAFCNMYIVQAVNLLMPMHSRMYSACIVYTSCNSSCTDINFVVRSVFLWHGKQYLRIRLLGEGERESMCTCTYKYMYSM